MNSDNSKIWHAVNVVAETCAAEAIEFAFGQLDALGTAINQLRKSNSETLTVTGYFNLHPDNQILRDELQNALRIYNFDNSTVHSITSSVIEDADWLGEWKKHWEPTTAGRFVIAPPWSHVADSEKIVIRIEPNMAFGTGTHETTQLCLKAIGENYAPDMSLLDVGTGTGILAIAAAKLGLGKTEILACDTDSDSVKIARENAVANQVGDKIQFFVGSVAGETPSRDFVCANLTIDVITPLLQLLLAKSNRILLLSGILAEHEDAILAEVRKLQIKNFQVERAGEWISVLITHN